MSNFTATIRTAWVADEVQTLVLGRFEAVVSENDEYTEWELFHRGARIAGDFVDTAEQGRAAVEAALRDEMGFDPA